MQDNDAERQEREKLQALGKRIDEVHAQRNRFKQKPAESGEITGYGVITELFAGILVGGGLGYYVDKWLGTRPIFFLILMLLGIAAAVVNIYKRSAAMDMVEEDSPEHHP